ncbi:hypothetical protein KTH89_17395 [Lachnospiraceae bacterium ASD5720]|uniref:Zinc finger LSD1-type domain-containing protein n=1 Tax=Diplocloster agilis TaxID=2850323 RepID=A0A949K6C6_9FIRM|nr:hypothetical protein [Diplocloster agilis]
MPDARGCRTHLAFFREASHVRCLRLGTVAGFGDAPDMRSLPEER